MMLRKLFRMDNETQTHFLIAGLGNPGAQYRQTRHNVGFMVVDRLAAHLGVTFSRLESKALVTKTDYQGQRLVLVKPHTFMNLSGQPISSLTRYYKVPHENCWWPMTKSIYLWAHCDCVRAAAPPVIRAWLRSSNGWEGRNFRAYGWESAARQAV